MDDTAIDANTSDPASPGRPRPWCFRALSWIVGAVLCAVALYGMAHLVLVKIAPEQDAPEGHFGEPCSVCHTVSASAELIEIE